METEWDRIRAGLRSTCITAGELITELSKLPSGTRILVARDEEFNAMFAKFEVSELSDVPHTAVIWGYSGSEVN